MDDFSLTSLSVTLAILLVVSGVFSLAETAMMAANRYRLKHRAARGERGAKLAISLLAQTDRLLGVILLGNNLINAAAATLTAVIVERLFGEGQFVLAAGTVAVTFAILVFSEITPKVIGATHADRLAPFVSYVLTPLLKPPITWIVSFVNLFVQGLLWLLRIRESEAGSEKLTPEELRSLVLEGQYFRGKHRAMLANLFELENITVDDVMTPRHLIHGIDLSAKPGLLRQQLATSYHTRLPVYEETLDKVVGILHVKQVVALQQSGEVDAERLRELLRPAYFVPMGTPLLTQLTQFQSRGERMALVVDEYGEIKGLTTIEDIIEEIIGEFTTTAPGGTDTLSPRERRQRRRRRRDAAADAEPAPRDPLPARRAEDAERADRRAAGRHPRCGHDVPDRGPDARDPADPGPRRACCTAATSGRPYPVLAFTKPGRAGMIEPANFMRME